MPRGGENHAQGGGEISRAQDSIFLPPLGNFSCTPLGISIKIMKSFTFFSFAGLVKETW